MCCGCDTSSIVSVHIQFQAFIFTLSLCRGHSWRVRLAKQETLTPPGHLVSPLVCRGPWMSTVVLYCWCHSDSASVLLYFILFYSETKVWQASGQRVRKIWPYIRPLNVIWTNMDLVRIRVNLSMKIFDFHDPPMSHSYTLCISNLNIQSVKTNYEISV